MFGRVQLSERNALRSAVVLFREIGVSVTEALAAAVDPALTQNSSIAILLTLLRDGPLRPQQLLEPAGLSSAGLSGALARLEGAGAVVRDPDGVDDDHRGVLVSLTPAGRRVALRTVEVVDAACRAAAEGIKSLTEVVAALPAPVQQAAIVEPGWQADVVLTTARMGSLMGDALGFTAADGHEVHAVDVGALCVVDEAGTCRPGYLVERLGLTSGGVTRVLDRLESVGLVRRSYGVLEEDRRGVFVTLTDAGVAAVTDAMERFARHSELVAASALLLGALSDQSPR